MTVKAAIKSMRLRTLPLSCGGVLLGILLAVANWKVDLWTAVLLVLTTVCLQILSNLSNELGFECVARVQPQCQEREDRVGGDRLRFS